MNWVNFYCFSKNFIIMLKFYFKNLLIKKDFINEDNFENAVI